MLCIIFRSQNGIGNFGARFIHTIFNRIEHKYIKSISTILYKCDYQFAKQRTTGLTECNNIICWILYTCSKLQNTFLFQNKFSNGKLARYFKVFPSNLNFIGIRYTTVFGMYNIFIHFLFI